MANYIFAYHGGKAPESPEEGEKVMAAWKSWLAGMGDNLVDFGAPLGMSSTVSATGVAGDGGTNPISGYSLVQADSQDAANDLAKGCPVLADGGSVEVAEIMQM